MPGSSGGASVENFEKVPVAEGRLSVFRRFRLRLYGCKTKVALNWCRPLRFGAVRVWCAFAGRGVKGAVGDSSVVLRRFFEMNVFLGV